MASALDDPLAPSPCEQCGNATEGTMRCFVQDSKNLCQDCFQDLPQARREDIGDPEWFCDTHLHREVDIFCETCKLGCCKECPVDVHKGHKLVNALKLVKEIRRDLTEQLQEVGVREERLSELRRKIENSLGKIEEAPKLVDKVVDEIKEKVAQNLEKECCVIQCWTLFFTKLHEENRDNMLKYAKEKADLDIQRIQEIKHGISTDLIEDAERRRCKIQKAESKLLVGQQACESANLQIKSVLESSPQKLACRGRRLCSLIKTSSAFQCQDDVLDCCREVEADLPKWEVEKVFFVMASEFCLQFLKIVFYLILIVFVLGFANEARSDYRIKYNRMLSSDLKTSLIMLCLYLPMYYACKCLALTLLRVLTLILTMADYSIMRKKTFMEKLNSWIKMVKLSLGLWLMTVLFHISVSVLLHLFEVESVSGKILYYMSIVESCFFLYGLQKSKIVKDCSNCRKLYKVFVCCLKYPSLPLTLRRVTIKIDQCMD